MSLVPTALRRIDASLFRVIVLGGAAPPEALPAERLATYGMTETGSGVVYDGVPLAGVEVAVDEDDGSIMLRGPMLLRCYRRRGTDPKHSGGWLTTGDVGELDDDGRLVVLADDRDLGNAGDRASTWLDGVGPDVLAAGDDQVAAAAEDVEPPSSSNSPTSPVGSHPSASLGRCPSGRTAAASARAA